ncbi:MAG: hypothetical protein HY420_00645 [Candidatus Kerfeldbacteria bacterium]|nr:hypothetical protein [Candidatus Kerfeldbacteria bacterium]
METKSPEPKAPLALQTLLSEELLTLDGMAQHLALLAGGNAEIRAVAVRWFGTLPKHIQVDLVRSVGRNAEAACQLVMLVPDASILMPHLGLSIVRRMCDSHPTLISAVSRKRLATMIRVTKNPQAKREWLVLIAEWNDEEPGLFESFIDELDPVEMADWLNGLFRLTDLYLLQRAINDPRELEERLDDLFPFLSLLASSREQFYRTVIGEIILRLCDRYERRSRLKTLDELQREYWPGLGQAIKETRRRP